MKDNGRGREKRRLERYWKESAKEAGDYWTWEKSGATWYEEQEEGEGKKRVQERKGDGGG